MFNGMKYRFNEMKYRMHLHGSQINQKQKQCRFLGRFEYWDTEQQACYQLDYQHSPLDACKHASCRATDVPPLMQAYMNGYWWSNPGSIFQPSPAGVGVSGPGRAPRQDALLTNPLDGCAMLQLRDCEARKVLKYDQFAYEVRKVLRYTWLCLIFQPRKFCFWSHGFGELSSFEQLITLIQCAYHLFVVGCRQRYIHSFSE